MINEQGVEVDDYGVPRNSGSAAAAPVKRKPTPEEQAQAMTEQNANPGSQYTWNGSGWTVTYPKGAPQANPVTAQTSTGSDALVADINRRQDSSMNAFGAFQPTSVLATPGRTVTTPQQRVQNAGASDVPRGVTFSVPAQPASMGNALATDARRASAPLAAGFAAGDTVTNPSKVEQGADLAKAAMGSAPTIDMGLADRQQGGVQQALDQSGRLVDAALAPVDQTALEQATADARSVLDKLLNGPNTAERLGSQTLRSQLALARSAAGGPGAVQEALRAQQQAAPELEAQAAQSATAETMQRTQAAGNLTGTMQQNAVAGENAQTNRLNAGANAVSGAVSGNLGARSQDIQIAQSNQTAASNILSDVAKLTGQQLELDQRNQEQLGQLARDAASMNFNWAGLDAQTQEAEWNRWVQTYQIDTAAAAQIAAAAKAAHKTPWDYIVPLIGAAATVGAAALPAPAKSADSGGYNPGAQGGPGGVY